MRELSMEQIEYAIARLVRLVEFRKMTQIQLEHGSGVAQSTISKLVTRSQESGSDRYTPSEDVLRKLFQALGLRLTDILNESDAIADEILGYLATPLTGLTDAADAELRRVVSTVRAVASDQQFGTPRFEIYWPGDHTHPRDNPDIPAPQVYVTDRSRASTYDFVILFCGSASYGVGQENEIATQAGVPAIRLIPATGISRMMLGSFVGAIDITYSGSFDSGIAFNPDDLRGALREIRKTYFRHRALYGAMNGDAFGSRLRRLVDDRCGDYAQFAKDLGISLAYLHNLMEEPFAVSNPSALLLRRMGIRLRERVAYLLGEMEETDPVWVESNTAWRLWIDKTPGLDARTTLELRDQWRHEYRTLLRNEQTSASFRTATAVMTESDWDARYQAVARSKRGTDARQQSLL